MIHKVRIDLTTRPENLNAGELEDIAADILRKRSRKTELRIAKKMLESAEREKNQKK